MSGKLAELLEARKRASVRGCKLGAIIESLDPRDREVLEECLGLPREEMSATSIAVDLNEAGYHIGDTVVRAHRNRTCACVAR